jgi:hypothetical protein
MDARKLQASFRTHWAALDASMYQEIYRGILCVLAMLQSPAPYFIRPRKKIRRPNAGIFYWPFALFASPACDFVYGAKTNNKQHKREI